MTAIIFLCMMKSHLFAMFMRNFTTIISLSIAEILLFIKKMVENCRLQHCLLTPCQYWRQRLRNSTFQQDNAPAHRARETVEMLSRETPDFISPLQWPPNSPDLNPVDYEIWGRLQERVYRSSIRNVNHLKERLIEDHNIICAAVNQWHTRLRSCVRGDGGHFEHQL